MNYQNKMRLHCTHRGAAEVHTIVRCYTEYNHAAAQTVMVVVLGLQFKTDGRVNCVRKNHLER